MIGLKNLGAPVLWVMLAIGLCSATAAVMPSDYSFYALALLPFTILLGFFASRMSAKKIGLTAGNLHDYLVAIAYPAAISIAIVLMVFATGGSLNDLSPQQVYMFAGMVVVFTIFNSLTTGLFFRGWLFGSMLEKKINQKTAVMFTAIAGCLWYIPLFFLDPRYIASANMLPTFLAGAVLDGMVWGIVRLRSGSILPSAVGRAVWDAATFFIFGFGINPVLLSVSQFELFGPQRGVVGVALRLLFVFALWGWHFGKTAKKK